jgi:ElaB/YqjD/DUF883 family membrane-anchored ribosome-binding protein
MEDERPVTTNVNDTRDTLARDIDHTTISAHETITAVSDAARPAVDRIASNAHSAVDRVAGVATRAAGTLGVKGQQLIVAEKKLVKGASEYLREHPVASLGVAIATGYVLSRLFSSRS